MKNTKCPYCGDLFEQGQSLTTNERGELVHLDCELDNECNLERRVEHEYLNRKGKKYRNVVGMQY